MHWPYRKMKLASPLSPPDAAEKLAASIDKQTIRLPFMDSTTHYFSGSVRGYNFTLTKNISYRNSFLPIVAGEIHPAVNGSLVDVTLRLHPFVALFSIVWVTLVIGIGGPIGVADPVMGLVPLGMLTFLVVLVLGAFNAEAGDIAEEVRFLFDGQWIKDAP